MAQEICEAQAKEFFQSCELLVESYRGRTLGTTKTPDFKVSATNGTFFYCEAKSLPELDSNKSIFPNALHNSLADKIIRASKQFKSVNPLHLVPNVLAWRAKDPRINSQSLEDLLKGSIEIGNAVVADLSKQRFGRVRYHLKDIDLHVWFYPHGKPDFIYTSSDPRFLINLQRTLEHR